VAVAVVVWAHSAHSAVVVAVAVEHTQVVLGRVM
jgi:hypothetical protein